MRMLGNDCFLIKITFYLVNFIDADCLVVAGTDKFFTSWRVVDVNNGRDVILVHCQRQIQVAHVEGIKTEINKNKKTMITT